MEWAQNEMTDVHLERLVSLAAKRELLEDWRYLEGSRIQLRVGVVEVTLEEPQARTYLRGLIRNHDLAHANHGGEQKET